MPFLFSHKKLAAQFSNTFAQRYFLLQKTVTCVTVLSLVFSTYAATAQAASVTPTILTYQGRLTDASGNLLGGAGTSYYMKFSLWTSPTVGVGTQVWPATTAGTSTVTVTQGVFTVNIGDTSNGYPDALNLNFSNYPALYLQVEVSSNNISSETLSPRQQLTSVPYAQVAGAVVGTSTPSLFGTSTPIGSSFVTIQATSSTSIPLSIAGFAGQTANLFQVLNNALSSVFSINSAGVATFANAPIFSALTSGIHAAGANGTVYSAATSSLAFSGPFGGASSLGALVGGSGSTITWTGLATTSQPSSSNLLVSNGGAGVYGVATSTLTASSPLTGSFTVLGSGGSLGCQTASGSQAGCLSSADWTSFNSKASFSWPFTVAVTGGVSTSTLMQFNGNASTTQLSATQAFFGGSATSTFTSSGYLGIGTTSPFVPLSVKGNFAVSNTGSIQMGYQPTVFSSNVPAQEGLAFIDQTANNLPKGFHSSASGQAIVMGINSNNEQRNSSFPGVQLYADARGQYGRFHIYTYDPDGTEHEPLGITETNNVVVNTSLSIGSLNGILKATGGVVSAAVAGTDYANFSWPFTVQSWGVSTSTTLGFGQGFLSQASSTVVGALTHVGTFTTSNAPVFSAFSGGLLGAGVNGTTYSIATSTNFVTSLIAGSGIRLSGSTGAVTVTDAIGYPFAVTGNATSTLTQFNGGLTAYATSTIGSGAQTGGLTISGGATTTGNAYFAGNVGIGTTSPSQSLSVASNAYFAGSAGFGISTPGAIGVGIVNSGTALVVAGAAAGNATGIFQINGGYSNSVGLRFSQNSATDASIINNQASDGTIAIQTNSQNALYINSSQQIGIGTTSPSQILSLQGSEYVSGTSFFGGAITATSTFTLSGLATFNGGAALAGQSITGGGLIQSNNTSGYQFGSGAPSASVPTLIPNRSTTNAGIGADTAGDVSIITNNGGGTTEMLRVGATASVFLNGNVGIGSAATTPQAQLESRNDGSAMQDLINVRNNNTTPNGTLGSRIGFGVYRNVDASALGASIDAINTSGTANGNNSQGATLVFNTTAEGSQGLQQRMTILNTGNVGIGTSTPYAGLSVWGTASGKLAEFVTSASSSALSISATGFGTTTVTGFAVNGSATSTSNVGFNLTAGCFAINGSCIGSGSGASLTAANTWTQLQTFSAAFLSLASSTIGNSNQNGGLTINGGATTTGSAYISGSLRIGTQASGSQLGNNNNNTADSGGTGQGTTALNWNQNSAGYVGLFYNADTTANGNGLIVKGAANSTNSLLSVDFGTTQGTAGTSLFKVFGNGNVGVGTSSPGTLLSIGGSGTGVNFIDNGTTTFSGKGINLQNGGCFSIRGTCVGSGSGASLSVANTWTALQTFQNAFISQASSTVGSGAQAGGLTISGGATTTGNAYFVGNVGVGTNNPQEAMHVKASSGTVRSLLENTSPTGFAEFQEKSDTGDFRMGISGSSGTPFGSSGMAGYFDVVSNVPMLFGTNNQIRMTVTNDGLIGLGTMTPGSFGSGFTNRLDVSGTGGAVAASVGPTDDNVGVFNLRSNNKFWQFTTRTSAESNRFGLYYNNGSTYTNELLSIATSGNVGIGTTTSNWNLQVAGTRPTFALSDTSAGTNLKHWLFSSMGGNLYIGTSTDAYATSSPASLALLGNGNVGIGTSTPWADFTVQGSDNVNQIFDVTTVAGASAMHITAAGKVGLGTTTSQWNLQVAGTRPVFALSDSSAGANSKHWLFSSQGGNLYIGTSTDAYATSSPSSLSFLNNGRIGIGTSSPTSLLSVAGNTYFGSGTASTMTIHSGIINHFIQSTTTIPGTGVGAWTIASSTAVGANPILSINSAGGATTTISFFGATTTGLTGGVGTPVNASYQNGLIIGNGKVLSSVTIAKGSLCVSGAGWCTASSTGGFGGSVTARNYITTATVDVAEMFPSDIPLDAGDIVAISSTTAATSTLTRATPAMSSTLVGIVSTDPGLILGNDGTAGKYAIALAGRVPVHVTLEGGPIAQGDRITLSTTTPGFGMKAGANDPTVGIALEPFTSASTGNSILAFVQLQNPLDTKSLGLVQHAAQMFDSIGAALGELADELFTTTTQATKFIAGEIVAKTAVVGKLFTQHLFAQQADVGTADAPAGITLYDTATHAPYCLTITNGAPTAAPGVCGSAPTPAPASNPAPAPDAPSTDSSTSTDSATSTDSGSGN